MEEVYFDRPFGLNKHDADLLKLFNSTLKDLRSLVISNIEFFQRGRSALYARFYASSCILLERTQILEPLVIDIVPYLSKFDFSDEVPGNGYRSFISLLYRCCLYLLQLCRHIHTNRSSLFFQSTRYCKDLESYVETLGQLVACLTYLKQLMLYCNDGELFLADDSVVGDSLLLQLEMLNTDCFYGRCLGFQFCDTIQKALQGVLVVMATFSECYEEPSQVMQLASSLLNSGKYVLDQELRARQVVNITRTGDIKFCKAFWSIPESPIFSHLRAFTFPHVEVSDVMSLDPENFELPSTCSDETVTITPPCAHTGPAPVNVRLISHVVREGQDTTRRRFRPKTGSTNPVILPKSERLLFHCHGGGFVAQSSHSHENYLRAWACELEIPILSVDYSLAPEHPFPRALEECFYAYAWALKNPEKLGWTGEKVCFAGDSAGANLVISTALRAVSFEIRVPDGILSAYAPLLIQYTPSPARFLSMIDPLLPVGILMRCLAAYAGIADEFSSALAKPIFCNPGTLEPWEVVDSTDTQHLEKYVGEIKSPSADEVQSHSCTNTNSSEQMNESSDDPLAEETVYPYSNGCCSKTGCECDKNKIKKESVQLSNNGATSHTASNLNEEGLEAKSNKKALVYTQSSESSLDDNEIVFVDSQMVPSITENDDNHSSGLIPSKFFGFIKRENPVKSVVSGVKSFMSRHKRAKVSVPDKETEQMISDVRESDVRECENEPFESDVDNGSPSKMQQEAKGGIAECPEAIDVENEQVKPIQGHTNEKDGSIKEIIQNDSDIKNLYLHDKESMDIEEQTCNANSTLQNKTNSENKKEFNFVIKDGNISSSDQENLDSVCQTLSSDITLLNHCGLKNENETKLVIKADDQQCIVPNHSTAASGGVASELCNPSDTVMVVQNIQEDSIKNPCQHECDIETEVNDCNSTKISVLNESNIAFDQDVDNHVVTVKPIIEKQTNESLATECAKSSVDAFARAETEDEIRINHQISETIDDDVDKAGSDDETETAEDMESYLESMAQGTINNEVHVTSSSAVTESQCLSDDCKHEQISFRTGRIEDSSSVQNENSGFTADVDNCDKVIVNQNEPHDQKTQDTNPDPCEMYAVCQELLDQTSFHGHENGDYGYHDTMIGSSSCHTLEERNSYYVYGDNRRLSIHSEGSCNSIEDSHAWVTGQDIDIFEVDANDIVSVISDNNQGELTQHNIHQGEDLSDPIFYIDTYQVDAADCDMSGENKKSKHCLKTLSGGSEMTDKTKAFLENTEEGVSKIEDQNNLNTESSKTSQQDGELGLSADVDQNSVEQRTEISLKKDDDFMPKGVHENTTMNIVSNQKPDSDSEVHDDFVKSEKNCETESDGKPRTCSDPMDFTNSLSENTSDPVVRKNSLGKQNRRTLSLDLTHNQNLVPNDLMFLTSKNPGLPRSSTVPELLSGSVTPKLFSVQRNIAQSPIQLFRKLPIVKNPYMSPILAPDDMMQGLPVVHLVACHFDPLLDDSIMFARKLRSLDKAVNLHIVDNLPHGFLCFSDASPEARQATKYCLNRIKEILQMEDKPS